MLARFSTWPRFGLAAATLVTLTLACTESPSAVEETTGDVIDLSVLADHGNPGTVMLCKVGPVGTVAKFSLTATGGSFPLGNPVVVDAAPVVGAEGCLNVWAATDDALVEITVTEVGASPGLVLESILANDQNGFQEVFAPDNSITVVADHDDDGLIVFRNVFEDPPTTAPCERSEKSDKSDKSDKSAKSSKKSDKSEKSAKSSKKSDKSGKSDKCSKKSEKSDKSDKSSKKSGKSSKKSKKSSK